MSVWKRLSNVAKGTVKQWQNDTQDDRMAALDRELSELERHPAPGEETRRRRAPTETRSSAWESLRNPAEEPVPRTDLFAKEDAREAAQAPGDATDKRDDDDIREGRDGRKL